MRQFLFLAQIIIFIITFCLAIDLFRKALAMRKIHRLLKNQSDILAQKFIEFLENMEKIGREIKP
jgi:hypothetical protein